MNVSAPVDTEVTALSFSVFAPEEIKRISVRSIVNPVLLDALNHPMRGGLYDPALGPLTEDQICATCSLDYYSCPGHFGHIELPVPVVHPLFFTAMMRVLKGVCFYCHKFRLSSADVHRYSNKLTLLDRGLLQAAMEVGNMRPIGKDSLESVGLDGIAAAPLPKSARKGEAEEDNSLEVEDGVRSKDASGNMRSYDMAVADERRRTIEEVIKAIQKQTCDNCKGANPTLRKDGFSKVTKESLSKKLRAKVLAKGLVEPNQKAITAAAVAASSRPAGNGNQGSDESEDDDDDEDDEDEDDEQDEDDEDMDVDEGRSVAPQTVLVEDDRKKSSILTPMEMRAHLRIAFCSEGPLVHHLFGPRSVLWENASVQPSLPSKSDTDYMIKLADIFFLDVLPVSPNRFRPAAVMADRIMENVQNGALGKILQTSLRLRELSTKQSLDSKETPMLDNVVKTWIQLQEDVNSLIDSSKVSSKGGKEPPAGVRQVMEKKEGLMRKNMMGKRVNYAARSVISPDPFIDTSEIGIPPIFASRLTYPEPVTPFNVHEMRQAVINGPSVWPGATHVQHEDGSLTALERLAPESRIALANQLLTPQDSTNNVSSGGARVQGGVFTSSGIAGVNKKVYRHLRNGDMLLLNRQPTLHKPSIMAHKARVLRGEKTIRMHYANCKTYNADFDGDEMNIHFPQNELARSECINIANTDRQYLIPSTGDPLRGLIQDHVVAGVALTTRDVFLTRGEYNQLLFGALRPDEMDQLALTGVLTDPPTIMKPRPMWTGKQVISAVVKNLLAGKNLPNIIGKSKLDGLLWDPTGEEGQVIFCRGDLVSGIMDAAQYGTSSNGLVHSLYELYGPEYAGSMLSILGRLFSIYNLMYGFTCRIDDLLLKQEANVKRSELLSAHEPKGLETARRFVGVEGDPMEDTPIKRKHYYTLIEEALRSKDKHQMLDGAYTAVNNQVTSEVNRATYPKLMLRKFPVNGMHMMVSSGAKGKVTNATQISCVLGQMSLEGSRVPVMVSGKTLPCFRPFEASPIAGGFIASRYLTGLKPQELYFNCMAGRDGLVDTAVKTSRSGYLQRCLIKHLENLTVAYDNTVRDASDGSVLQFLYGEDAIDVTKSRLLKQFDFVARNYSVVKDRLNPQVAAQHLDQTKAEKYIKKANKEAKKAAKKKSSKEDAAAVALKHLDPVQSKLDPTRYLGSVSENFHSALEDYISKNPSKLILSDDEESASNGKCRATQFRSMMYLQFIKSLIDPGEVVGLLAAQSVGEPSTQMTLNTFHSAGSAAANVTMGIPRLREIIMTASAHIALPQMYLPVLPNVASDDIERISRAMTRIKLSDIVDRAVVTTTLTSKGSIGGGSRMRKYTIRLELFPENEYQEEYSVASDNIERTIERVFVPRLELAIARTLRRQTRGGVKPGDDVGGAIADEVELGAPVRSRRAGGNADSADDDGIDSKGAGRTGPSADDEDGGEDIEDVTNARTRERRRERATYDEPEQEDLVAMNARSNVVNEDQDMLSSDDDEDGDASDSDADAAAASKKKTQQTLQPKDAAPKLTREQEVANRERRIKENSAHVTGYRFANDAVEIDMHFPARTRKVLMVAIVEKVCHETIVREVRNISTCTLQDLDVGDAKKLGYSQHLVLDGVNFRGVWPLYEFIDINKIDTNDIAAVLRTYGVEACYNAIMRQIMAVFKPFGISIDRRHLSLIADYMTFEGGFKPFNRYGIESQTSPLLKMSFETTCHFLTTATLHGEFDNLDSPSARIVMGRPMLGGTGAFNVRMDLTGATGITYN
ncbi:beta and beta-prime subunits of DNA dependent RNA-polymerase [Ramicandelaber brevisporus]|nr:beta and beta-prime subunits of DNA dependent RNA-polymerase [Ramicandelaber brevisporus]